MLINRFILKIILALLLFLGDIAYANEYDPLILIAHAGGSLNGERYLNSKEAVENSIRNGFKHIELDLLETTDHDLLAAHNWKDFHELTGYTGDQPISATIAKNRKILSDQTVLTSEDIVNIFLNNKDLVLVTDKIQNIDLIIEKFKSFKNRLIVEVFSIKKYKEAKGKGLIPAFCVWNSKDKYNLVEQNNVEMITLSSQNLDEHLDWFKSHKNVTAFAFSINGDKKANDVNEIKKYYPFIRGWYTDVLTPNDLKNIFK